MESGYNQFQCPLCGRTVAIRSFDPSNFDDDVIGIRFVGLGRGRGFEVAAKGSLLDSEAPVLDKIADRVAEVYDLFFETDDSEELLEEINEALEPYYDESFDEGFDNLIDAAIALLNQFLEQKEDDNDDDESIDTQDFEDLSDTDKEIWIVEHEEDDEEDSE